MKSAQKPQRIFIDKRVAIATLAAKWMSEIMACIRVTSGLLNAFPQVTNNIYKSGDKVFVKRKNIINSRIREWIKPLEIEEMDDNPNLAYVRDDNESRAHRFLT